jgi:large subunit ribosomal protein L13
VTADSGRFFMIAMPTTKTFSPRPRHIERRWYVLDAEGVVLGRLASEVAKILRGKHKPIFAPHVDAGDHVIVVNASGIRLTGGKEEKKTYYRHSGYPGGLREIDYARLLADRPVVAVEKAVRGMLPKNRLGRQMIRKLSVYEGAEHPHQAQRPEPLELGAVPKWDGLPDPKVATEPASTARGKRRSGGGRASRTEAKPAGPKRARSETSTIRTTKSKAQEGRTRRASNESEES